MKQGIPKSVQDLLARQTAGDEHPSADLLNGYMEQSLTASEIARVTNHLAACGECREIVFLASAVHEEEMVPAVAAAMAAQERQVVAPASRRKSSWVWWKWAVSAVAVIVVAGGVLVERDQMLERSHPGLANSVALNAPAPSTPATNQTTREFARDLPAPTTSPLAPNTVQSEPSEPKQQSIAAARQNQSAERTRRIEQQQALQKSMELAQLSSSLEKPRASAMGGAVGGMPAPPPAKAAPPPSTSRSVAVTSAAPLSQAANADLSTSFDQNVVGNAPNGGNDLTYLQKSAEAGNSGAAGKDESAPAASLKSGLVSSGQPAAVNKLAKALLPATHWRISADGHLERALPGNPWTRVLADQPVAFHVVAVVGSNVWAGGNGGALFHSTDQGESWNRVALSLNGQTERSAVVSIHFDNAVQGSLSTVSGATWVTSDGGLTWIKR